MLKKLLLAIIAFLIICCSTSMIGGSILIILINSDITPETIIQKPKKEITTTEYDTCTYYSFPDEYVPQEEIPLISQVLLQRSGNHFTFTPPSSKLNLAESHRVFYMMNLENQYCRLKELFGTELDGPTEIKLTFDAEEFAEDLGVEYDTDPTFTAFARGEDFIEIYDNPYGSESDVYRASTLSHELVHSFQFALNPDWQMPTWFIEGMASAFAEPQSWLTDASDTGFSADYKADEIGSTIRSKFKTLEILNDNVYSTEVDTYTYAYDASHLFVLHLIEIYGEEEIIDVLQVPFTKTFDEHYEYKFNTTPETQYQQWLVSL